MTFEPPQRLHPAAIVVEALRSALQLVGGIVLVAVVRGSGPGTAAALALAGIAGGAAIGYARWRRTSYWIDDVALHYRSGVFTPDEKLSSRAPARSGRRHGDRGAGQRLFGVVELRVQVPGAADAR